MHSARFHSVLVVSLAVISACSEDVSTPLAAAWLEWSDSVSAGVPFGVRVSGLFSENPASLRIRVTVARDTVAIQPYSVEPPCRQNCSDVLRGFDTLVWVPAIAGTAPRTVVIRATSPLDPLETPWPLRRSSVVAACSGGGFSAEAPRRPLSKLQTGAVSWNKGMSLPTPAPP